MLPDPVREAGRIHRLAIENGLVWRAWDGEIVVLNEASGDTHQLDLFSSAAFEALLVAPADTPALTLRLAEDLHVAADAQLEAAVAAALQKFAELSLLA